MKTKKETKKVSKKSQALAVQETPRRMAWGGVIPMVGAKEEDTKVLQAFCNKVAQIYGVPSLGVNAMGGNPYLNKDGRLFLLSKYKTGKIGVKGIKTDILEYAKSLNDVAIVKTIIEFKDGTFVEGIGEASKENCKLDAVKKTLNMMAETRSLNRAIWKAIGFDVWNGIAENIAKMKMSAEEKQKIIDAGKVSYEEMQQPEVQNENPTKTPDEEIIEQLKAKIDDTNDVNVLMDYAEKLADSNSSKKIKDVVGKYIQEKVANLS